MARGWESKSVEEQINAREAEAQVPAKKALTPIELKEQARRDVLLLARAHTLNALQSARHERYRAQLERALEHLNSELAKTNLPDS